MKSKLVLVVLMGAMALGSSAPNAMAGTNAVGPRAIRRSATSSVSKGSSHAVTKANAAKRSRSANAISSHAAN